MSTIRFVCPFCNSLLEIDQSGAGMDRTCPRCQGVFNVPAAAGAATASAGPEPLQASPAAAGPGRAFAAPGMPPKVQTVRILMIVGGAIALSIGLGLAISCVGLIWPGTYYSIVLGFMAIFRGASMKPPSPRGICVMQIVNLIVGDLINVTLGIVQLILLSDPECEEYFARAAANAPQRRKV